ncbi:hypothetical protein QJQ45_000187 [Haematococcus lacustris]|nr:hypothetical protein QJQ45_000187 [Haematococcus lacustris]
MHDHYTCGGTAASCEHNIGKSPVSSALLTSLLFMPAQGKLPAKGKEYPGLGYKRVRDKPPKAQQQQPAVAQ